MELALNEVKTQAKKLLKALNENEGLYQAMKLPLKKAAVKSLSELKLKHCLKMVSHQLGFDDWHHAQQILSGNNTADNSNGNPLSMGTFFYYDSCGSFLNEWFVDYCQAQKASQNTSQLTWILPYKNQFIVVKQDYMNMFKLDERLNMLWDDINYDMINSYNNFAWDSIACAVIKNRPRNY